MEVSFPESRREVANDTEIGSCSQNSRVFLRTVMFSFILQVSFWKFGHDLEILNQKEDLHQMWKMFICLAFFISQYVSRVLNSFINIQLQYLAFTTQCQHLLWSLPVPVFLKACTNQENSVYVFQRTGGLTNPLAFRELFP